MVARSIAISARSPNSSVDLLQFDSECDSGYGCVGGKLYFLTLEDYFKRNI